MLQPDSQRTGHPAAPQRPVGLCYIHLRHFSHYPGQMALCARRKPVIAIATEVDVRVEFDCDGANAGVCGSRGASFDCKSQVEWSKSDCNSVGRSTGVQSRWLRSAVNGASPSLTALVIAVAFDQQRFLLRLGSGSPIARTCLDPAFAPHASGAPDIRVVSCAWCLI
jgi:hypothetical protein